MLANAVKISTDLGLGTTEASFAGLLIGCVYLAVYSPSSFAIEQPFHCAIVGLSIAGLILVIFERYRSRDQTSPYHAVNPDDVSLQPLSNGQDNDDDEDLGTPVGVRAWAGKSFAGISFYRPDQFRVKIALLACCTVLRVETWWYVLRHIQCTKAGYGAYIVLLIALYECWRERQDGNVRLASGGAVSAVVNKVIGLTMSRRSKYMPITFAIAWSSSIVLSELALPRSSYICAISLWSDLSIKILQPLGLLLDCTIVLLLADLINQRKTNEEARNFAYIGWSFLACAVAIILSVIFVSWVFPGRTPWTAHLYPQNSKGLVSFTFFSIVTSLSVLHLIAILGLLSAGVLTLGSFVFISSFASAWQDQPSFPGTPDTRAMIFLAIMLLSIAAYTWLDATFVKIRTGATPESISNTTSWFYMALLCCFVARGTLWSIHRTDVSRHPIDILINNAANQSKIWTEQASTSESLSQAVQNYRSRYSRLPPPGFDRWYEYATNRSSIVIDDYDSIDRDLAPFWTLTPEKLRQVTVKALSKEANALGGISVRDGKVEISTKVDGGHMWMLDGLLRLIEPYAEWLPDMTLAFNINDECRVSVPHERLKELRLKSEQTPPPSEQRPSKEFSKDRAAGWKMIRPKIGFPRFQGYSRRPTFYDFGSVACPPSARARTERLWDTGRLCVTCAQPHSLGPFVANWTLAADSCHQPDMANMHGLFTSPAAMYGTNDLVPIFSQSKFHGYHDILLPSPWNYVDKVKYEPSKKFPDPEFADKENTLFWRGATSEGLSDGSGAWKAMTRQRLVHLANKYPPGRPHRVLLPYPLDASEQKVDRLRYTRITAPEALKLFKTDVKIVGEVVRCDHGDCRDQTREFDLAVKSVDFQSHWEYRFLFDADGAGFSGRFLPFLRSRSLPIKTAMFREWYDDRLTAWHHFVPEDPRLQGIFSTLAYFAGVDGLIGGRRAFFKAHVDEAQAIAEQGREWANKVLRKEDMEVYFFRLLLEWGRLTDDARDSIGFTLDE